MDWTGTHCGRRECRVYGGPDCQRAREAMFKQYLKMIEAMEQKRRDAASKQSKEGT